jgi:hypothetical protein
MARKQKARLDKDKTAEQNRTLHGRTKTERLVARTEAARQSALVEGHFRIDKKPDETP